MKKLFVMMALGLGMVSVANAQYAPQKGDFATEIGFTPFHSKGNDGKTFKLNEGMFKVRYFLTDKDALRLKLGVGIDNSSTTKTDGHTPNELKNDNVWNSTTEINKKKTTFSFKLGYERHLMVSGRFDVYAGAEFGYEINKYSGDATYNYASTDYDSNKKITSTTAAFITAEATDCQITNVTMNTSNGIPTINSSTTSGDVTNAFVGAVFAGLDFYVYKNLYLGAELGLSFKSGKKSNSYCDYTSSCVTKNSDGVEIASKLINYSGENGITVTKELSGNATMEKTTVNPTSNETTTTKLEFYVEPAIRLGWRF